MSSSTEKFVAKLRSSDRKGCPIAKTLLKGLGIEVKTPEIVPEEPVPPITKGTSEIRPEVDKQLQQRVSQAIRECRLTGKISPLTKTS